jgi:hypothetical protein
VRSTSPRSCSSSSTQTRIPQLPSPHRPHAHPPPCSDSRPSQPPSMRRLTLLPRNASAAPPRPHRTRPLPVQPRQRVSSMHMRTPRPLPADRENGYVSETLHLHRGCASEVQRVELEVSAHTLWPPAHPQDKHPAQAIPADERAQTRPCRSRLESRTDERKSHLKDPRA